MRLDFWRPVYPEYERVIVNCKTNRTFRGIFVGHRNQFVVLKQVEILTDKGPTSVDGDVLIPLAEVEFIQVIK